MICDFLASFSRRDDKRQAAPVQGAAAPTPDVRPNGGPLERTPDLSRKAQSGASE